MIAGDALSAEAGRLYGRNSAAHLIWAKPCTLSENCLNLISRRSSVTTVKHAAAIFANNWSEWFHEKLAIDLIPFFLYNEVCLTNHFGM
ncbi:hypothetical protein B9L19_07660 [Geobacillus thermocatenulatus]|uniref:Uncharacterized protein n=1 Tax=Geobacillus thermocatenulatus TaxID=33938 RepID=A0A226QEH5_9BACL|nr:hypothetical protein GT3921_08940 [Geobacillus thermocatenulatus]OXB89890.1 hypothetical protein B9L19_07660 [Geobacillus thermocatenulatus]